MQRLQPAQENDDLIARLVLPNPISVFTPAPGHEPTVGAIESVVEMIESEPALFALEYLTLGEQVRQQHSALAVQGIGLARIRGEFRDLESRVNAVCAPYQSEAR